MIRRDGGSQSESDISISDPSQPFEPREDDILFEVIEITGEKKGKYKVRWEGNDPNTLKPWPQSWVSKRDCTDDLVLSWKRAKKERERRKSKPNGRDSSASRHTSRSVASTSRIKSRSGSVATSSNTTRPRNQHSASAGPSNAKSKLKNCVEVESTQERDLSQSLSAILSERSKVKELDLQPEGKRKFAEVQSATSSGNHLPSRHITPISTNNDAEMPVVTSDPPKKKRKFTSGEQPPVSLELSTRQGQLNAPDARRGSGRTSIANSEEENDASEYVMVMKPASFGGNEGATAEMDLPEGNNIARMEKSTQRSPEASLQVDDVDDGKQSLKELAEGRPPPQEDIREVSDEVDIIEAPPQPRKPTQPIVTLMAQVKPVKKQSARMMVQPPPPNWKSPASIRHGRQSTSAGGTISGSDSKAVSRSRPDVTSKKSRDSSHITGLKPAFEQDMDSDDPPRPSSIERQRKGQRSRLAAKPLRHEVVGSDDANKQPSLSPRARQRLAIFDIEVMGKKGQPVETKRPRKVNESGGEASPSKSTILENSRPAPSPVRPLQFGPPSYVVDFVPETELESSQEDNLRLPSAVKVNEKPQTVAPINSTVGGPPITKTLRPLPQISPSAFHPHLQPPNSSLTDSIEPASSHERRPAIEAIEQFESPEHSNIPTNEVVVIQSGVIDPDGKKDQGLNSTRNEKQTVEEVWDTEIVQITEQAEAMRRRVSTPSGADSPHETTKKKSMQEIFALAQSRNRSDNGSRLNENIDEEEEAEEGVADASTVVVPPASGPPALSQDPPLQGVLDPRDDKPVDSSGAISGAVEEFDQTHDEVEEPLVEVNPESLRQEEEESTQDLMAELRERQENAKQMNPREGDDLGPPFISAPPASINSDTNRPNALVSAEESDLVIHHSHSPKKKGNDDPPRGPITRSRSRSQTPSVFAMNNTRANARGKKRALSIPSPVPSRNESAEPEPEKPVDVFQNAQGSSATSSIMAAQILLLQSQVNEKQLKIDSLLDTLREQLTMSEERNALLEAHRQRQIELESQWASEKSAWESERTLLNSQNAMSEKSRIQAEQDREFIRDQYANASAYVTAVREENKELEQRVKIAEEQSTKGVELIKATFESRVAKLQDEAKAWRRMAEFVMEKDMRTNDDVRRRAAEESELRTLCRRQRKGLKDAMAEIEGLQIELRDKAPAAELEHWKTENARLQSDLNEALIKLDRIGRSEDEISQGDGHEFVYRCLWRAETENSQSACPEAFATMRELEGHIYSGHLSE